MAVPIDLQTIFYQWEAVGVFDFVLPGLLIFAVIYGILSATGIFGGNRGVDLVVALAIAGMALRFGFVQAFFGELFPRFGVALAVLLSVVILAAIFIPKNHMKGWAITFGVAGAIFGLIAVISSFDAVGWFGSYWIYDYLWLVIGGGLIITIIVIMVAFPLKPDKEPISFGPWRMPSTH